MVRWIRILLVVLGSIWRAKLGPDGQSVLNLRVWITDADFFAVSVGAYLTYFEMGRVDLQLRTGFARLAMKMRWFAPTRSIVVEYWKPLRRFQRFQVFVKVLYWDDRWVYTEERIERNGSSIATALCKSTVLGRAGRIAPAAVASALGFESVPPSQPLLVRKLQEAEELMREPAEGLCRS
jgi:acyl-CoA thioesterase FadM